jgi:hypothetical protein
MECKLIRVGSFQNALGRGGRARRRCIFSQMHFYICTTTTMKVDTDER